MILDIPAYIQKYSKHQWRIISVLFLSYILTHALSRHFLPPGSGIVIESTIALSSLYFGGLRLWPAVYVTALVAQLITGGSAQALITYPIIEVLQASAGAYLLHRTHIDPLFRRYRDMFYFITSILLVSFIGPTALTIQRALMDTGSTPLIWWHAYIASLFSFLIFTPLLLRWFTKPQFSRTRMEWVETAGVFVILFGLTSLFFTGTTQTLFSVPLLYPTLVPLFWISLRLRPRFTTLALAGMALIAILCISPQANDTLSMLFKRELFLIALSISFFIVTSLEEDRRVNTNLMHSQMGTLRNAISRISSESQAKNDFIAILAHELRNPLSPVVSSIDLLKLKGGRDEEETKIFDLMEDRMATVRRLLDDLLDISRISEGKVALKNDKVDIDNVLRRAVVSTEHHRKELHQRLVFAAPTQKFFVRGDAIRLEQVFSNLLTNASKYSSSGDTIRLVVRETNGMVEIEIADHGVGLSEHEIQNIFLPFHQIDQGERSQKGLGIGLSLVLTFVEMHDGKIEVKSEGHGMGSRFTVSLPILLQTPQTPTASIPPLERGDNSKQLVLIIDDNDAASGSLGRLLEFEGCEVAYAYNGAQGIEKTKSISPSIIILDIGLPDMDGYRVASAIKASGFSGHLIALSGYSTGNAKEKGRDAGFERYLVKPVSLSELRQTLFDLT